jgi:hypothetical protein
MKATIECFARLAAVAVIASAGCLPLVHAQCTSPTYSPDFTSNQACLHLNGNATLPVAGAGAAITGWTYNDGAVTFTTNNPSLAFLPGEPVILSGFATSTFFNTQTFPVASVDGAQFTILYAGVAPTGPSDAGTATPLNLLQLTPAQVTQSGSAWYTTPQPVSNSFSTTFTFQLTGGSADGFAFVIQNSPSGLTAAVPGGPGCTLGFAGDSSNNCGPDGSGIKNSVAVAFKTHDNGTSYPPRNSVFIASNGTGANCVNVGTGGCVIAQNPLTGFANNLLLADGNIHTVTVTYVVPGAGGDSPCGTGSSCLDVILDGHDLFAPGVPFDITTIGLTPSSTAFVGFTGSTGADVENNDILSWVFTPAGGSQTGNITPSPTNPVTFNVNGGFTPGPTTTSGYDYTVLQTDTQQTLQMVVTAIPMSQSACNALVQPSFPGAQCFVYQNGAGLGQDAAVMFEVTCPANGSCGSSLSKFDADLGTDFHFSCSSTENAPLVCPEPPALPSSFGLPNLTNLNGLPEVGLLKGDGPDPVHPCTPFPNPLTSPLFQSNQISSFSLGDVSGAAHGGSGGTTSCWVMTYGTPNELPSITITQPANGAIYPQTPATNANYSCSAVNLGSASPVGPYLTAPVCTGTVASGTPFDTSTLGPHTFTVQVQDSAENTNSQTVSYLVAASAPSSGKTCNGYYTGTFKGNITVSKGQNCVFVGGGVNGNIAETGGNVSLINSLVTGSVAVAGGTFNIGPGTVIKGGLGLLDILGGSGQDSICGATIGGSVAVTDDKVPVLIGDGTAACPGNHISGSLLVSLNASTIAIYNNVVGSGVTVLANSKPTKVFSNKITGSLACSLNSSISGGSNIAGSKLGQCKTF